MIWYPGADNETQNFQAAMNRPENTTKAILLIHTTETQRGTWPGYGNGATAPNLTVQPDTLAARGHFPVDHAAQALKDPDGTAVRENRVCCQIEIVATCDERNQGNPAYDFVGDLSDEFYRWLGDFVAWYAAQFPEFVIQSPVAWKPYNSGKVGGSCGLVNGVRLSDNEFANAVGIVGHQHASGNDHGDPGLIDIAKILAYAGASSGYVPPASRPPVQPTGGPDIDLAGDVWVGLLHPGTTDSDSVRRMQKVLVSLGLGIDEGERRSGTYGPSTDEAVRAYQQRLGNAIDPPGRSSLGPKQAARLFTGTPVRLREGSPGAPSTPSPGGNKVSVVYADRLQPGVTDSDSVRAVQQALNAVRFAPYRNIPVNGNYDQVTRDMAAAYQTHIGNAADGLLGPKQTARLFSEAGMALDWRDTPSGSGGGVASPAPAPSPGGNINTPFPGAVVGTPYGKKGSWAAGFHTGVDYPCPVGTPLRATWTGTVVAHNAWGKAYGNHVIYQTVIDGQVTQIAYCHMSSIEIPVGAHTVPDTHLGKSGNTGNTTGAHVHVEFRVAPFRYNNRVIRPQM